MAGGAQVSSDLNDPDAEVFTIDLNEPPLERPDDCTDHGACILTGEDGENLDDCTAHDHK
jgi:hypothetical protein